MRTDDSTALITGGGSGIGLALARALAEAGSTVIICGRTPQKLDAARARTPALHTRACDVADPEQREALLAWVLDRFPALNLLVNNAGVCEEVDLLAPAAPVDGELVTNLEAPIGLATLFLPHLLRQDAAAVVNVSSALAFVPLARHPVYCAAKAGLHSFSQSLRHQLAGTSVRVVEVIPPAVDTPLNRSDGPKIPPERVAGAVLEGLRRGQDEIRVGQARVLHALSRLTPRLAFSVVNG